MPAIDVPASFFSVLLSCGWEADGSFPGLLASLCAHESGWDPLAVSDAGARGLCQFMPDTWAEWGEGDFDHAFDPERSIIAASRYLYWCVERTGGDVWLGVLCYAWGPGNVGDWLEGGRDLDDIPADKFDFTEAVVRDAIELRGSDVLRSATDGS